MMRSGKRRDLARQRTIAALSLLAFAVTFAIPPVVRAQTSPRILAIQAMSTRQKVVLLAGAAALYWLCLRHLNAREQGAQRKNYRSRDGRIYYRYSRTHRAI